jgi:hypothetical protein
VLEGVGIYKERVKEGNQASILTPEDKSSIVGTGSPTQCQISWPTSMAALSGIRAGLVLEW